MGKILLGLAAVSLAVCVSGYAKAEDKAQSGRMDRQEVLQKYHVGPYVGVSGGLSTVDTGVENLTGSASVDEDDYGFKVYGGYQFTNYFGAEGHYARLGTATLKGNNGDTFSYKGTTYQFTADATVEAKGSSIGIAGTAGVPVSTFFFPYLKAGVHRWSLEESATSSAGNASFEDSGFGAFYGVGASLRVMGGLSLRAEYEQFRFEDSEVDFISLGGQMKF